MKSVSLRTSLIAVAIGEALASAALASTPRTDGNELQLVITAAVDNGDPAQCGASSDVVALRGQAVNLCYTVTNDGATTFGFHSIVDPVYGRILVHRAHVLAPGESYRFNRIVEATQVDATYSATWVASDVLPGFDASPAPYDFVDISTTGTIDFAITFDLPFPIAFFDETDTQTACLVDTGALQFFAGRQGGFGQCGIWTMHDNTPLPVDFFDGSTADSIDTSTRFPVSWMPVYWDYMADFFLGEGGGAMYQETLGDAPNRRFVAEWQGFHHISGPNADEFSPGSVTFEAIIEEATGRIVFQYQDTTFDDPAHPEWDDGGTAGVGFQYGMDLFDAYSNDAAVVPGGTAIAWTSNGAHVATSPSASATIHPGTARIAVSPSTIDAHADVGASASTSFDIANGGTLALDWSLDEASRGARVPLRADTSWLEHAPARAALPGPALHAGIPLTGIGRSLLVASPAGRSTPSAYAMSALQPFGGDVTYQYKLLPHVDDPASAFDVSGNDATTWLAAGFVANDFSKEYAITYPDGRLQTLSTEDGHVDDIGSIDGAPNILQWASVKWDAGSGTVYAMGLESSGASYLYRLDVATAHVELVAPIVCDIAANTVFTDIAIDADGRMFGIDIQYDGLFEIDKATGAATPIGPLGYDANYAQALDFDHATGVLYLSGYDELAGGAMYTVDTTTGNAALVEPTPGLAEYWALAVASFKGDCASSADVPWLSASPSSGTVAPGASSSVTLTLDGVVAGAGYHEAFVCVGSSDSSDPAATVDVRFLVGDDAIFADGFDGH
jgi:hypothetical protein